jgi:hypothetical protein
MTELHSDPGAARQEGYLSRQDIPYAKLAEAKVTRWNGAPYINSCDGRLMTRLGKAHRRDSRK